MTTDLNGKNRKIYASGLRNTIGFGWHPVSKKLFGMDHGIDMLGDNDQEEELNETTEGKKYGWAYVYSTAKLNPHNYHFQVFALDKMLDLPSGFNRQALLDAMKGHVIAKGEIVGMYQHKPDVREKK